MTKPRFLLVALVLLLVAPAAADAAICCSTCDYRLQRCETNCNGDPVCEDACLDSYASCLSICENCGGGCSCSFSTDCTGTFCAGNCIGGHCYKAPGQAELDELDRVLGTLEPGPSDPAPAAACCAQPGTGMTLVP